MQSDTKKPATHDASAGTDSDAPDHIATPRDVKAVAPLALSLRAAAKVLAISPRYLQSLVAQHKVAFSRIGRRMVFRVSSLDAYLASVEEKPEVLQC